MSKHLAYYICRYMRGTHCGHKLQEKATIVFFYILWDYFCPPDRIIRINKVNNIVDGRAFTFSNVTPCSPICPDLQTCLQRRWNQDSGQLRPHLVCGWQTVHLQQSWLSELLGTWCRRWKLIFSCLKTGCNDRSIEIQSSSNAIECKKPQHWLVFSSRFKKLATKEGGGEVSVDREGCNLWCDHFLTEILGQD